MSNRRILGFTWLVLTVIAWLVLRSFVDWIWVDLMGKATLIAGSEALSAPHLIALLLAGGLGLITWRHEKVNSYSLETVAELRKVVWPTRDETREGTIVVLVFVFILAGLLGGFDFVWAKVTNLILYRAG